MIKITESTDYSKYKTLINQIMSDIMSGDNAQLIKNIRNTFKEYGGSVDIRKVSPTYLNYDGNIKVSIKRGNSWLGDYTISGSIDLSNLKQDVGMLAEDIAYVMYLNDGGKEIGTTKFLDLVY